MTNDFNHILFKNFHKYGFLHTTIFYCDSAHYNGSPYSGRMDISPAGPHLNPALLGRAGDSAAASWFSQSPLFPQPCPLALLPLKITEWFLKYVYTESKG